MRDNLPVTDLVTYARNGEKHAWDALVERYAPLIWSICRRHGLGRADTEDVGQAVWLQPGGTAGQPARCGRVAGLAADHHPAGMPAGSSARADRLAGRGCWTLRTSRTSKPRRPTMNCSWPSARRAARGVRAPAARSASGCSPCYSRTHPVPYAEISARLGIPVGSIGPKRRRCLDKLRRHPAIAALIDAEAATA